MAAGSNSFTPQEFLDKLGKDELNSPLTLTGMVKASEGSSTDLMFVIGTRCGNWTSVPIDIIDNVDVLGSVPCDDHSHHRVTLTLKTPQSPEAAVFAALLSAAVKQQTQTKRIVRKGKGGGLVSPQNQPTNFLSGCGCSDYEIDADGTVWQLTDVVDFEDGSCICTYMHA
jgi:hypothetical protein